MKTLLAWIGGLMFLAGALSLVYGFGFDPEYIGVGILQMLVGAVMVVAFRWDKQA